MVANRERTIESSLTAPNTFRSGKQVRFDSDNKFTTTWAPHPETPMNPTNGTQVSDNEHLYRSRSLYSLGLQVFRMTSRRSHARHRLRRGQAVCITGQRGTV